MNTTPSPVVQYGFAGAILKKTFGGKFTHSLLNSFIELKFPNALDGLATKKLEIYSIISALQHLV